MLFRIYGSEKVWFDQTWRRGVIELVKQSMRELIWCDRHPSWQRS